MVQQEQLAELERLLIGRNTSARGAKQIVAHWDRHGAFLYDMSCDWPK